MLIISYFIILISFQSDEYSLVCLLQNLVDMDVTYEVLIVIIPYFFQKISAYFNFLV